MATADPIASHPEPASVPSAAIAGFLGRRWLLRGTSPAFEYSPEGDDPPYPREMLSLSHKPQGMLPIDALLAGVASMMAPLCWAGRVEQELIQLPAPTGVVHVVDNPLTGRVTLIARVVAQDRGCVIVTYDLRGEPLPGELERACAAVQALRAPLLLPPAAAAGAGALLTVSEGQPLGKLAAVLDESGGKLLDEALSRPDVAGRHVMLAVLAGRLLRDPGFVESVDAAAFADIMRVLEGAVATFIRLQSDQAAWFAASLLARGLLANPATNDACVARALQLSELLMAKTEAVHRGRWQEAVLTNLLARVVAGVRAGTEDYGDLGLPTAAMQRDVESAIAILTRLVNDSTFVRALHAQAFSRARVARCDLALTLLQRIGLRDSTDALVGDLQEGTAGIDGVELLRLHERLPQEFEPAGSIDDGHAPVRFMEAMLCAEQYSRWELERYYGIDLPEVRQAVLAHVDRSYEIRPNLLFLRGFRSVKRVWLENTFSFARPSVIPFPHEPPKLSLEAALVKGLAPFNGIAIGGLGDPLGMGRMNSVLSDEETWKKAFNILVDNSAWIFVLPDRTDAVNWEIQQLIARGRLGQVVLIMLPLASDAQAAPAWEYVVQTLARHSLAPPPYDNAGAFVLLAADGGAAQRFAFEALMDGSLGQALAERTP